MRKNLFSNLGNVTKTISMVAILIFLFAAASYATTYTVSGYVREGNVPVSNATVYLVNGSGNVNGSCHTGSDGYFVIQTTINEECQLIAIPDDPNSEYVPTFYPNYPDSHRGYVIYPADMPENIQIDPLTDGGNLTLANGSDVLIQGHIDVVNISGVSSFIYVMNGERVVSHHSISSTGDYSFTEKLNSNSSVLIVSLGYKDFVMNYNKNTAVNSDDGLIWILHPTMESLAGNGSVVTPSLGNSLKVNQNYPNPFNPTTNISFSVANAGLVKVLVYDLSGRMVSQLVNEYKNPGSYSVTFNASALSSGIYFYSIENGNTRITKQMMLVK